MTTFVEKFVSVAGAGAHDGSSAANAWTMAEATANVSAGDRPNVIAGTYIADDSGSGAVMDLDVAGTANTIIQWRAYTTTIGDFTPGDAQPVVLNAGTNTLTHAIQASTLAASAYNEFIGFRLTGASSHGFNGGFTTDFLTFIGCKIDANGGKGILADNNISLHLCEFTGNTTNAFDADEVCVLSTCKFHNEAIATAVVTVNSGVATYCLFYDNANGLNLRYSATSPTAVIACTFDGDGQAASTAFEGTSGTAGPGLIINNIFFDLNTGVELDTSAEDPLIHENNLFSTCTNDYSSGDGLSNTEISNSVDPFTNSGTRDYTLASGSAAIATGIDAGIF